MAQKTSPTPRPLDLTRIVAIVANDKGGVGKSQTAQLLRETFAGDDDEHPVALIDCDPRNSSMAQVFRSSTRFADLRGPGSTYGHGPILQAVDDIAAGRFAAAVADMPAGTQVFAEEQLIPDLVTLGVRHGIAVIEYVPYSTSEFTLDNVLDAAERAIRALDAGPGSAYGMVMVRNHGLGRLPAHYADWDRSAERKNIMGPVIDVSLPDFGPSLSDEATALGLSLADVALGRFEGLEGRPREIAEKKFPPAVRIVVSLMIERVRASLQQATRDALTNFRLR